MSLWQRLAAAANWRRNLHVWVGSHYVATEWGQLVRDAENTTFGLRQVGVKRGARVAALLTNTPEAIRGMLGVWFAGGTLASLPLRARGMGREEYAQQIATICGQLEPTVLLADEAQLAQLPEWFAARVQLVSWESVQGSGRVEPSPPGDDDVAFVQYSSGSTGTPKGCMLTPRAILNQSELVMEMVAGTYGSEVVVSWLPLSHDMGFFGAFITPLLYDLTLFLSSPQRFATSPRSWFADVASVGATVTVGTNTALAFGTRPYRKRPLQHSLANLKVCIIGAERVEWDTLASVIEVFRPNGFRPECLMPAYGLAEATLTVTATPIDERPRYLSVDAVALAEGHVIVAPDDSPSAAKLVSAGRPCRGVALRGIGECELGEIQIQSECLTVGYMGDPERTRARLTSDGLLTEDLGFLQDGYLYLVGRTDDMLALAGRKVYAREIEAAVEAVEGIRQGSATIVECPGQGLPGKSVSRLVLLVERRAGQAPCDYSAIAEQAAAIAMKKAAVCLTQCIFLPTGALPKTPSGKTQRRRCGQLLNDGRLIPLATVNLS